MSNRLDNTRIVIFKEAYLIKGRSTPVYEKTSQHPIHFKTVEKLKANGAKMDVSVFDEKTAVNKAKEQFQKINA